MIIFNGFGWISSFCFIMQLKLFEFKENVKRYRDAMNILLASSLQSWSGHAQARTNTWHIWRVVARMWSEKFQAVSVHFMIYDMILCCTVVRTNELWDIAAAEKENNHTEEKIRSMLSLNRNRTHKYENILNHEEKRRKKASESSACIVHAEVHTDANCNRFIDCSLSRLSLSCFVLFYFEGKLCPSAAAPVSFDLWCTHHYF